jgi:hypothetical protein
MILYWKPANTAPVGECVLLGRWEARWDYDPAPAAAPKRKLVWATHVGVARTRFLWLFAVLTFDGERYSHWTALPDPIEDSEEIIL